MGLYQVLVIATLASVGSSIQCYFCQNANNGLGYDPECGLDEYDGKTFSSNNQDACFTRIYSDNRAARGTMIGGDGCMFGEDFVLCICEEDLCNNRRCNHCFNDTTTAITEETTPSQIITDVTEETTPSQIITDVTEETTTSQIITDVTEETTTSQIITDVTDPITDTPEPTVPTTTDVTPPAQGISCYSCSNSYGSVDPPYDVACGTHPYLGDLEHCDSCDTCFTHVYDDGRVSRNAISRDETEPCHYGGISGDAYIFCYCKEDGCNNELCYQC